MQLMQEKKPKEASRKSTLLKKFEECDQEIAKSDDDMKNMDLRGTERFVKWHYSTDLPPDMGQNGSPETNAPASLKKTSTAVKEHDGVVIRVVYLAERMQVESMFVHKNCFRCAYCSQPLRIGECGKDKDLEFHFPRRFFCRTHLRLPLKEKIARIERAARTVEKNINREKEMDGQLQETGQAHYRTAALKRESTEANEPLIQCTATLSFFSPEQLRDRTVQRMRDGVAAEAISPVSEIPFIDDRTPERAEFSNHVRKSSVASSGNQVVLELDTNSLSSTSDFEDEELEECAESSSESPSDSCDAGQSDEDDASISEEEGDELEEGDLEELERTVLQYSEENPEKPLTEEQVVSVIESINRRRDAPLNTPRGLANSPRIGSDSQQLKKAADLERLRTESRLKAKQKTDEELGLDPENKWAMDSWFALVHENEILKSKEEMLRLSKREVELEVKYRDLNMRFKQLGEGMNDNLSANSDLLAAMLAVVEEKKEVNRLCESAKQSYKKINSNMKALKEKGRNFERFKSVFSRQ
ncbi:unnamed protein product [Heligmosomoides polygyrus]|uniref:BMERB domain-containing protein n=1 Tax=Heligmosomoides polygyrus TaxID=6339 RepID=A0A3P8AFF3_HELPZ|nr:unnamed protein product [Heligmosomoides polygyrus]